jgi:hypothetical protein
MNIAHYFTPSMTRQVHGDDPELIFQFLHKVIPDNLIFSKTMKQHQYLPLSRITIINSLFPENDIFNHGSPINFHTNLINNPRSLAHPYPNNPNNPNNPSPTPYPLPNKGGEYNPNHPNNPNNPTTHTTHTN